MKTYADNSPQAIARILAMFMIGDGQMDERELAQFDRLNIWSLIGIERKAFIVVMQDFCNDLADEAEDDDGRIRLFDVARVNEILDYVDDRKKRILTAAMALDLCKADDTISEPEMALYTHMLERWGIQLDDIEVFVATI
jgi:hypothetical protein